MSLVDDDNFQKVAKPVKKGIMNNWIVLALIAVVLFAAANLAIADLGTLGFGALYFFNSGGFVVCVIYFIVFYCKYDYKNKDYMSEKGFRRNVWTYEDGSIAWFLILNYCFGAVFQGAVFMAINETFIYAVKADLNVGIPSAIWAINPFFTALLEYVFRKVPIKTFHFVGMSIMMISAVMMAVSNLAVPPKVEEISISINGTETITTEDDDDRIPVYIPILIAFIMPVISAVFSIQINYVICDLKIDPWNWAFGYNIIYSGICLIAGIIKFSLDPSYFSWSLFTAGCLGSFFNTTGSLFCGAALGSGYALGPIIAVLNTQTILVTLVAAAVASTMPNYMQWIGLFLGMFGACVLTMPEQMYTLWYRMTRCKSPAKK